MTKVTVIYSTKRGPLDKALSEQDTAAVLSSMRVEHSRAIRVDWESLYGASDRAGAAWREDKKPVLCEFEPGARVDRLMKLAKMGRG